MCDSVRECDKVSVTVDPECPCVTHGEGRAGACPQAAGGAPSRKDYGGQEAVGAWGSRCAPGFGCCVAGEPEMEMKEKRWGFSREVREEGRKGAESKRGGDRQEPQP